MSKRTRKVTTTITFRIDADTIDKLRVESTRHDVSLNTSVNKILKRHVQWDMFEPQAGTMPLAKPVVAELLANMSKEQITNLTKNVAKTAVQDILLVMKGKIDLDSFLSWFETLMKKAFIEINHTVENNDSTHRYTVKHNLGENWALLIKSLLQIIFNDVLGIRIDIINLSNTTLVFQFENNGDQAAAIIHSTSRI
ncbi:MAG: hypothetical protein WB988_12295 [Candidatus Nitrosopolaris sp.]|jgi:hypothetical protein